MIWAGIQAIGEFLALALGAGGVVLAVLGGVGAVRHLRGGRRMTPD